MANLDSVRYVESPLFGSLEPLVMSRAGQIVAEHVIEVRVQTTTRHFFRILQFECSGSGISRVGKQRFFLFLTFFVERFETLPWQQHFAA